MINASVAIQILPNVLGDYNTLMEIVKNCQIIAVEAGAPSLMSFVKICYNPTNEILTIDKKITKHQDKENK